MTSVAFDPDQSFHNDKYAKLLAACFEDDDYLWMGKAAQVGQRVEIRVGGLSSMSGILTHVGPLITPQVFQGDISGPILEQGCCLPGVPRQSPRSFCPSMLKQLLRRVIDKQGTVHGQTIVAYTVRVPENGDAGLPAKSFYQVTLTAVEQSRCDWKVTQVIPLDESALASFPSLFCKWWKENKCIFGGEDWDGRRLSSSTRATSERDSTGTSSLALLVLHEDEEGSQVTCWEDDEDDDKSHSCAGTYCSNDLTHKTLSTTLVESL